MKESICFLLLIFLLLTGGKGSGNSNVNYVSYNDIPDNYSLDDAKKDNCVVYEDLDISSGQAVWDNFIERTEAKKPCVVRLAFYYTLGNPEQYSPEFYEEIKDSYPRLFVKDLSFDGEKFTLYYTEGEKQYSYEYTYLKKLTGKPQSGYATYSQYTRFVLVNDDSVTWEQIEYSMLSSQSGDHIDHHMVYCDLVK